jgi:hypothetical protein
MVVRLWALGAEVTKAHVPDAEGVWLELTRNVRHFYYSKLSFVPLLSILPAYLALPYDR